MANRAREKRIAVLPLPAGEADRVLETLRQGVSELLIPSEEAEALR